MRWQRFLVDTLTALVLAASLFAVGWFSAAGLLAFALDRAGVHGLLVTSPHDLPDATRALAWAFAFPALAAWGAGLASRAIVPRAPRPGVLGIAFGVTGVMMLLGIRRAIEAVASVGQGSALQPMISVASFDLAGAALRAGSIGALAATVFALVQARRSARPSARGPIGA